MSTSTAMKKADAAQFKEIVDTRRRDRMDKIDRLPADVRQCVHEYGYTVVRACMDLGITKSKHIRHLVETVLNEFSPTRGPYSAQGLRGDGDGIDGGKLVRRQYETK